MPQEVIQNVNPELVEVKIGGLGYCLLEHKDNFSLMTAPELFSGDSGQSEYVWHIGCLFVQLISGKLPFKGHSIEELIVNLHEGSYQISKDILLSIEGADFINECLHF